ncbi:hypothetical protein HPP92_026787 [Vanilla planifolia]|uniref:RING-type E3 ubiquitin transferase n=1 Tax=Vanilla planifolia TaxID=51239 RepID=A0A835PDX7_VANPL|nr:hypothetical protein HPP92_026787 [Vanilla planifolia]
MSFPWPANAFCYSCDRFVRALPGEVVTCPDCHGGFLEEVARPPPVVASASRRRRASYTDEETIPAARFAHVGHRRGRRASVGDRYRFNPIIVLRGSSSDGGRAAQGSFPIGNGGFELYYDDRAGSGLRPLPQSMTDFLMGSGFDRLLDQLSQMEGGSMGGGRSYYNNPASKDAIDCLPTLTITPSHIAMYSHCAVCTEPFELGNLTREMPCKHIFHQGCILPWLSLRNSCPVCRHLLPADEGRRRGDVTGQDTVGGEENPFGLTIWRLPGGGFAVGRDGWQLQWRQGVKECYLVFPRELVKGKKRNWWDDQELPFDIWLHRSFSIILLLSLKAATMICFSLFSERAEIHEVDSFMTAL